jgi:hypothetical protein
MALPVNRQSGRSGWDFFASGLIFDTEPPTFDTEPD